MISVIMPAYNASRFIAESIESVLNQTYQDFELIVVDDGSSDDTVDIVEYYAAKDERVRLIRNDHGGACKARNTAIAAARYPWIAPLDADDVAMPNRLDRLLHAAEQNPDVVVWGSYMYQINTEGRIIGTIRIGPTTREAFYNIDRTKEKISIINPTSMFQRDLALQVGGYDERLQAAQEVELWDRLAEFGPMLTIPEPLVKYRYHNASISSRKYYTQRMLVNFVLERNKARQRGETLTLDDFIAQYRAKPPLVRFQRYLKQSGQLAYRNAGVFASEKQYARAVLSLLSALVMHPQFTVRRLWNRLAPSGASKAAGNVEF